MATGVQVWSGTAASNATADTNINWAEGMAPSAVNDSARALMASVAKWRDDNNGTLISSGTSSALTLVTNQVEGANTAGYAVKFQFGTPVVAGATLAVDGLTATPLQLYPGHNLLGGEFGAGTIANFTYSSSGTGQWIWNCGQAFPVATASLGSSVTLSTAAFTDGPTVSLGTSGVWYVTGAVVFQTQNAADCVVKLWDGTTPIASGYVSNAASAVGAFTATLSGVITNPAANLKISGQMIKAGSLGGFLHTVTATTATTGLCYVTGTRLG